MTDYYMRRKIIRILKKHKPQTVRQLTRRGVPLKFLASGCFRRTYAVVGFSLVLKFAKDSEDHTLAEMRAYERIKRLKKWLPMRRYLPSIYYVSPDGRWLLMRQYPTPCKRAKYEVALDVIERLTKDLGKKHGDLHNENARLDDNKNIKLIDLGLLKRPVNILEA